MDSGCSRGGLTLLEMDTWPLIFEIVSDLLKQFLTYFSIENIFVKCLTVYDRLKLIKIKTVFNYYQND